MDFLLKLQDKNTLVGKAIVQGTSHNRKGVFAIR